MTAPVAARWQLGLAGVALLAALALVFLQTTGFGFVAWDDPWYVMKQPMVLRGLGWEGVLWSFDGVHAANWHPLTWLSLMADVSLFGPDPGAMHGVAVALHALNTVLLWGVLTRLTRAPWKSLAVAALFALHPLHVEPVAWISQRKELLAASFGLLALLAHGAYAERRTLGRYLLVVAAFAASLLAKATWITLPVLLLLVDAWPLGRLRDPRDQPREWLEKLPLLAVAAAVALITIWAQQSAIDNASGYSAGATQLNVPIAYLTYLRQFLAPFGLSYFYPLREGVDWALLLIALATLGSLSVLAVRWRRQAPWFLFGWSWFLVSLLPVIGLIKVGSQAHADRYTYMPLIGLFVIAVWALERWTPSRRVGGALVLAWLLGLAVLSHAQVQSWKDDVSLYRQALAVDPGNLRALVPLAALLEAQGRDREAVPVARALLAFPAHAHRGHYVLSLVALKAGRHDLALEHAEEALRLREDWWYADDVVVNAALATGRVERAREALRHMLDHLPEDAPVRREREALLESLAGNEGAPGG